jgi:cupredoxin-like protein
MEFESKTLKVEKVLSGNSEAVINIRPQKAGRYEFFDEFHEKTTRGALVVK